MYICYNYIEDNEDELLSKKLIVSKFGGTSLGDADAIMQSARVAIDNRSSVVVVSATSGTTDALYKLAQSAKESTLEYLLEGAVMIKERHLEIAGAIGGDSNTIAKLDKLAEKLDKLIQEAHNNKIKSRKNTDSFVSIGEQLSSVLVEGAIKKLGTGSDLVDATAIIKTDAHFSRANPNLELIREACESIILPKLKTGKILITQGYVGSSPEGEITTLGRGGSDYTAALIAEAIGADLLQIWTDVPGIATTDPRITPNAEHIKEMTFQEAAELATAGAKILYPKTIIPSRRANIPVYVGNTSAPESKGTLIKKEVSDKPLVRAIALKTDQRLITITTLEMAQQFGFLAKLFEVFARYKVSIDQISTSEISVAVAMDNITLSTDNLLLELQELGRVSIEEDISVISLIGNDVSRTPGLATKIFSSLETKDSKIAIRMICQGASKHNFCFLVADKHGRESVKRLHKEFVEKE